MKNRTTKQNTQLCFRTHFLFNIKKGYSRHLVNNNRYSCWHFYLFRLVLSQRAKVENRNKKHSRQPQADVKLRLEDLLRPMFSGMLDMVDDKLQQTTIETFIKLHIRTNRTGMEMSYEKKIPQKKKKTLLYMFL